MRLRKLRKKLSKLGHFVLDDAAEAPSASDVQKVLDKLRAKETELHERLAAATSDPQRTRLRRKLDVAQTHIDRAAALLEEVSLMDQPDALRD